MNDKLTVKEKADGKRLDIFLSENFGESRSKIQKLIKTGGVLLNGAHMKKVGMRLKVDDKIELVEKKAVKVEKKVIKKDQSEKKAEAKVKVIVETEDYLVVNKPSDLLTHPTQAEEEFSLASWILKNYPEIQGVGENEVRPGIVHRLDKDASGVMVVAKNQTMFEHLKKQFQSRSVEKEYIVLVHGVIENDEDTIDFDIDRGKDGRMVARPKTNKLSLRTVTKIQPGKESITGLFVEERFARYSLLKVKIHTGRTHQIRVHMLAYNHPVVGDNLYYNKKLNMERDRQLGRLFLHASKLCFEDLNKERVCFESKLPNKLNKLLKELN